MLSAVLKGVMAIVNTSQ